MAVDTGKFTAHLHLATHAGISDRLATITTPIRLDTNLTSGHPEVVVSARYTDLRADLAQALRDAADVLDQG